MGLLLDRAQDDLLNNPMYSRLMDALEKQGKWVNIYPASDGESRVVMNMLHKFVVDNAPGRTKAMKSGGDVAGWEYLADQMEKQNFGSEIESGLKTHRNRNPFRKPDGAIGLDTDIVNSKGFVVKKNGMNDDTRPFREWTDETSKNWRESANRFNPDDGASQYDTFTERNAKEGIPENTRMSVLSDAANDAEGRSAIRRADSKWGHGRVHRADDMWNESTMMDYEAETKAYNDSRKPKSMLSNPKPKNPTRFNMVEDVYEGIMKGFGATPGELLDPKIDGGQRVWSIDPSRYDDTVSGIRASDWFNPDGTMRQTTEFAAHPGFEDGKAMGRNPNTNKLSVGERWKRGNQIGLDHLYGQNAEGGKPLKGAPGNKTYGWRIPDSQIGPSHTVDSLMNTANEVGAGVDGRINMTKAEYDKWYDALKRMGESDPSIQKILDDYKFNDFSSSATLKNSNLPRHKFVNPDVLPDVPKGLVGTGNQVGNTVDTVMDTTGKVVKGAERTVATAGKAIDDVTGKGLISEAKPFNLYPSEVKSAYSGGKSVTKPKVFGTWPFMQGVDDAVKMGMKPGWLQGVIKIGSGLAKGGAYVLPELMIEHAVPGANQKGRDRLSGLLGDKADTDNWGFDDDIMGLIGKFGVDMFANTAYTLAGTPGSKLKKQKRKGGGLGGRYKGLISGS